MRAAVELPDWGIVFKLKVIIRKTKLNLIPKISKASEKLQPLAKISSTKKVLLLKNTVSHRILPFSKPKTFFPMGLVRQCYIRFIPIF